MAEMTIDDKNILFRSAREGEENMVYELYKAVIGTRFCIWDEVYPGLLEIEHDREKDNLFLMEIGGRPAGAISIVPDNELDNLNCWNSNKNVGEFARVVVHPDFQGKHLAKVLVRNVLEVMKKRGYENVHISVACENIPAQKTYQSLGFQTVGQAEMWGHSFYLCEYTLTKNKGAD